MSTLLKNLGGQPFMHMTSDQRTVQQLEGPPDSNTVFHTSLPYVLTSRQFEIDTYQEINKISGQNGTGARVFDVPQECISFRSANPRRLYFVVLYTDEGGATFHYPMLNARYEVGRSNYIAATASGAEHQVFFDSANLAEYEAAWRIGIQDTNNNTALFFKYDRWEPNATKIVVTRSLGLSDGNVNYSFPASEQKYFASTGLRSEELKIVRVRIVFLNTEVSSDGLSFNQRADFSELNQIRIADDSFDIGNYDLANNMPLRIIRTTQNLQPLSDIYGEAVTFKRPAIDELRQSPTFQKINYNGVAYEDFCTDSAGTICADIPRENNTNALQVDLQNKTISRNRFMTNSPENPFQFDDERTPDVFSPTVAGSGMRVLGARNLRFTPSFTMTNNMSQFFTFTGWTSSFNEDCFYIASLDFGGEFTGAHFINEGNNLIAKAQIQNYNATQDGLTYNVRFNFDFRFYLEVGPDSRVRGRGFVKTNGWTYGQNIPFTFTNEFRIALLAIAR